MQLINDSVLLREKNLDDSISNLEHERKTFEEKRKLAITSVKNIIDNKSDLLVTPRTDIEALQILSLELQIKIKEVNEEKQKLEEEKSKYFDWFKYKQEKQEEEFRLKLESIEKDKHKLNEEKIQNENLLIEINNK